MSEADPVDAAWAELEARWDDADAHKRFLALCVTFGRLPDAAARYRKVKDGDPSRADRAAVQLEAVVAAATIALYESKSTAPQKHNRLNVLALAVAATLVLAALWAWLHGR